MAGLSIWASTLICRWSTGRRLLAADTVRREWPFNVMMRMSEALLPEEQGAQAEREILVQGAIDCCFVENGKWVLLDYKTDRVLRDTLNKTCADATRLIVAQRIGTIRDADKIIVLEDGKIAGMGRHEELMESCEVYRQIAYSQLSKEELA